MARTAILTAAAIVVICVAFFWLLRPVDYYPVTRIVAPGDIALGFIGPPLRSLDACAAANERMAGPMLSACHACSVAAQTCLSTTPPELASGAAGASDRVVAANLTVIITAPGESAHLLCQSVAAGIALNDASAHCVPGTN